MSKRKLDDTQCESEADITRGKLGVDNVHRQSIGRKRYHEYNFIPFQRMSLMSVGPAKVSDSLVTYDVSCSTYSAVDQ